MFTLDSTFVLNSGPKNAVPRMGVNRKCSSDEPQEKPIPRPLKPERVGRPEELNHSLGVEVLKWYHPGGCVHQLKKLERVGHPPITTGAPPVHTPTEIVGFRIATPQITKTCTAMV